jgi:hypothetical protein
MEVLLRPIDRSIRYPILNPSSHVVEHFILDIIEYPLNPSGVMLQVQNGRGGRVRIEPRRSVVYQR